MAPVDADRGDSSEAGGRPRLTGGRRADEVSAISRRAELLHAGVARVRPLTQPRRLTLVDVSILLCTALALGLRIYQLARPNYLSGPTQYDDGADFGSALRLLEGSLPYRDFVFVQPPGIALLLSPVALLAKAIGTDGGLVVARILTVCASATGVLLLGRLVRHRGPLATTLACGILAVSPDGILDAGTVFLEPWLVLACLIGASVMFEGDELTSSRSRLALGGIAFGVAGTIKVWAILPVLVLVWLVWRVGGRRSITAYVSGVAGGFVVLVIPFFVMAPNAFFNDVVVAQLSRADVARVPLLMRLASLSGITGFLQFPQLSAGEAKVILATVAIAGLLLVWVALTAVRRPRSMPTLDRFAIGTVVVVLLALLWPPDYYPHYAGFFAPLLGLAVGLAAAGLVSALAPASVRRLTIVAAVGIGVMAGVRLEYEAGLGKPTMTAWVDQLVRPGSCVLTDDAALTIAADRFISSDPGCSKMVDAFGTSLALNDGRNGLMASSADVSLDAVWLSGLRRARFVWIQCGPPAAPICDRRGSTNRLVPWTPETLGYFRRHFRTLATGPGPLNAPARLYVRLPS